MCNVGRFALAALASAAAFGGSAFQLPDGPAKKLVEASCSRCHPVDVLAGKQWSRQRWNVIVLGMSDPKAPLSKPERAEVVAYLAKNFGIKDRGRELVEDICSLCHEWERVKDYPQTRDEWAGTIKGMIFEGAPVTDDEFDQIVDYLAKNYGKKD